MNSSQRATSTGNLSTLFHIVNILFFSPTCFIQTITRKALGLNILTEETSKVEKMLFTILSLHPHLRCKCIYLLVKFKHLFVEMKVKIL